jgi:hypothetical protein
MQIGRPRDDEESHHGGALEGCLGDPARGGAGMMAGVQILMSPLVQFRMSLDAASAVARNWQ